MSSFLRSLIAGGHVPFLCDYRTGSIQSLSGTVAGTTPTVTNTPKFQRTARGMAADFRTGRLTYAAAADQVLTQATWFVVLPTLPVPASGVFERVLSKRDITNNVWEFVIGHSAGLLQISMNVGATSTNTKTLTVADHKTVAWTLVNGQAPQAYAGGVALGAGAAAVSIAATNPTLVVGALYAGTTPLLRPLHLAGVINVALSPAEVARLHRELTAVTGIVARARKGFSIPYPVKTPGEYAAEGVIYDAKLHPTNGRIYDLAGVQGTAPIVGVTDVSQGGPFTTALRAQGAVAQFVGDPIIFNTNNWTISSWVRQDTAVGATYKFFTGTSPHYLGHTVNGRWLFGTADAAGVTRAAIAPNNTVVSNRWDHVVGQREVVGADLTVRLYVNSLLLASSTYVGAGAQLSGATTPVLFSTGSRVSLAGLKFQASAPSLAEIRKEYLEGARKCLLDARIHSDGSCPVSLAAIGAGNEIANGWKVQSGTWKVVEDAPSGGRAGERGLSVITNGMVYTQNMGPPFGAWLIRMRYQGGACYCNFLSDRIGGTNVPVGYALVVGAAGEVFLRRNVGGGHINVFLSPNGTLVSGQEYAFWITRRVDSVWTVWVRGGAYTTWTLVPVSTGTNPATDAAYTTFRQYACFDASVSYTLRGYVAYTGEMLPAEAIPRGLIDP